MLFSPRTAPRTTHRRNRLSGRRARVRLACELLESRTLLSANQFAVIGDYGTDSSKELAVANMVKSWNPGFVITLGDNNYPDGEASTIDVNIGKYYQEFIGNYQGTFGPGSPTNRFFPSLGNHDWHAPGAVPYLNYFTLPGNERYYDYVMNGVHFFVVDSDPDEPDGVTANSVQGQWLQNALAQSTTAFQVVYFHHAPYSSSSNHGSNTTLQWPFKQWGADVVLAGHDHTYERLNVGGIPYFVNGVGGHHSLYPFGTPLPESQVRYNANHGAMRATIGSGSILFEFFSITNGGTLIDNFTITATSSVVDRQLFYAGSVYDSANHDTAIASDKQALRPGLGQSTFDNISSYTAGINGLLVDLSPGGTHASLTANDFTFRVSGPVATNDPNGTDGNPAWTPVAVAPSLVLRPGAGTAGSDRVELTWPNGQIANRWLEVTVKANTRTGLSTPDIFYFGSRIGDSGEGNDPDTAFTDATDEIEARSHQASDLGDITNRRDFNRDDNVDATDQIIAQPFGGELGMINIANPPHAPTTQSAADAGVALALAAMAVPPSDASLVEAVRPPLEIPKPPANPARTDAVFEYLAPQSLFRRRGPGASFPRPSLLDDWPVVDLPL